MFNDSTILITGGTGSFGKKYTQILLEKYSPKKIIIFSRDEFKPVKGPTASRLIIRFPMPTAATFTGSSRWPIKMMFMVSKSMKKIEPIEAGIDWNVISFRIYAPDVIFI